MVIDPYPEHSSMSSTLKQVRVLVVEPPAQDTVHHDYGSQVDQKSHGCK